MLRGPGEIDLLFTDVVMPGGLFGPQLAKEAARLRPDLEVLFTSGYSEHPGPTARGRRCADPEQAVPAARSGADAASVLKGK